MLELLAALIIPPLISTIFRAFFMLKTSQSHSHIRGLYGTKKRMGSRCECVLALTPERNTICIRRHVNVHLKQPQCVI